MLIMLLLIVVFCSLIWLDPTALFRRKDKSLSWNQEERIVGRDESAAKPNKEQPQLEKALFYKVKFKRNDEDFGEVFFGVNTDGRAKGEWSGKYYDGQIMNEIIMSNLKGNIDPSYTYSDSQGMDYTKLYVITKGNFALLRTDNDSGRVSNPSGFIYITGFIDSDNNLDAVFTVTYNKREYEQFAFKAEATEGSSLFFFFDEQKSGTRALIETLK